MKHALVLNEEQLKGLLGLLAIGAMAIKDQPAFVRTFGVQGVVCMASLVAITNGRSPILGDILNRDISEEEWKHTTEILQEVRDIVTQAIYTLKGEQLDQFIHDNLAGKHDAELEEEDEDEDTP